MEEAYLNREKCGMNENDNSIESRLTKDSNLVFASFYAKVEADECKSLAEKVLKEDIANRQATILMILSIELYIKTLLMILGVDVICKYKNNDGHNLYKLFKAIPDDDLKKTIIENACINRWDVDSFEKTLKEISRGFIEYRYEYEKYLRNEIIEIPIRFICRLNIILSEICNRLSYEEVHEDGTVNAMRMPGVYYF